MPCTSQVADLFLKVFEWAKTGADPELFGPSDLGIFPMRANSQRFCVKNIITREGVGHGDQQWLRSLAKMRDDNPELQMEDFFGGEIEAEDDCNMSSEERMLGVDRFCHVCM